MPVCVFVCVCVCVCVFMCVQLVELLEDTFLDYQIISWFLVHGLGSLFLVGPINKFNGQNYADMPCFGGAMLNMYMGW